MVGPYVKAGLLFTLTRTLGLGLEYRHFEGGEVSMDDTILDSDIDEYLIVVGLGMQ